MYKFDVFNRWKQKDFTIIDFRLQLLEIKIRKRSTKITLLGFDIETVSIFTFLAKFVKNFSDKLEILSVTHNLYTAIH